MDLRDIKEFFRDFIGYIITFVIIIFIFTFIVAFHPIAGNSMVPALQEGNIVAVNKFYKFISNFKRNQIIIVKKERKTYVKRVIGLPGENIYYKDDTLYVNEKEIKEEFLSNEITTYDFNLTSICGEELCKNGLIPEDYYFVLGDNRTDSKDSRNITFGLVHKDEIDGLVMIKIWPINDVGKI